MAVGGPLMGPRSASKIFLRSFSIGVRFGCHVWHTSRRAIRTESENGGERTGQDRTGQDRTVSSRLVRAKRYGAL